MYVCFVKLSSNSPPLALLLKGVVKETNSWVLLHKKQMMNLYLKWCFTEECKVQSLNLRQNKRTVLCVIYLQTVRVQQCKAPRYWILSQINQPAKFFSQFGHTAVSMQRLWTRSICVCVPEFHHSSQPWYLWLSWSKQPSTYCTISYYKYNSFITIRYRYMELSDSAVSGVFSKCVSF